MYASEFKAKCSTIFWTSCLGQWFLKPGRRFRGSSSPLVCEPEGSLIPCRIFSIFFRSAVSLSFNSAQYSTDRWSDQVEKLDIWGESDRGMGLFLGVCILTFLAHHEQNSTQFALGLPEKKGRATLRIQSSSIVLFEAVGGRVKSGRGMKRLGTFSLSILASVALPFPVFQSMGENVRFTREQHEE